MSGRESPGQASKVRAVMGSPDFGSQVAERLHRAGVDLRQARSAGGIYTPWLIQGDLLHISGQVSALPDREGVTGCLGRDVTSDDGRTAARICAINLLAQVTAALAGDLDRFGGFVHVRGFVQAVPGFRDLDTVMDGCSDFLVDILGPAGRAARTVVGVSQLPRNHSVEIEAIAAIEPMPAAAPPRIADRP